MSLSLKKLWSEYGIGALIVLLVVAYGISVFASYLTSKGRGGNERLTPQSNSAYSNTSNNVPQNSSSNEVVPSEPLGQNEYFSPVQGINTPNLGIPTSSNSQNIQDPSELLPKNSSNNAWASLNPSGKGDLENINLLRAGYHMGIDTVGQSMRNPNLQLRSEPPNPQLYVGPFNQSTMTPDFMRPPLEIGSSTYAQ